MHDIFDDILRESIERQVRTAQQDGTDKAIVALLQREGLALEYLPEWSNNEQAVLLAVQNNGRAISFAHPSLQNDKPFILKVVTANALAYPFLYGVMQCDRDVIHKAIQGNYHTLQYMSHDVREDVYIMAYALQQSHRAFAYCSPNLRHNIVLRVLAREIDITHVDIPFIVRDHLQRDEIQQAVDFTLTSWKT